MNPINDNELVLYHYRDGLDERASAKSKRRLQASEPLRTRYARLCACSTGPKPQRRSQPAGFEQRLWAGLDRRMADRVRRPSRRRWPGFERSCFAGVTFGRA